jgi:hypothetical protein
MWKTIKEASDWTSHLEKIECPTEGCDAWMADYPEDHHPSCQYHAQQGSPEYRQKESEILHDGMDFVYDSYVH